MDISTLWLTALPFLRDGIRYGLVAGLLAGGIAWVIVNHPDFLFRAAGGFLGGAVVGGLFYGAHIANAWGQILAAAGAPIPQRVVMDVIFLVMRMFVSGLGGALILLFIGAPMEALLGSLTGSIFGILLGTLLSVIIQWLALPAESLLYAPFIGLLLLIGYAIYGSS